MIKLNNPYQNNNLCVFSEYSTENMLKPANFDDKMTNASIFVAPKIVNTEAMVTFDINQS
jgi:hypothetical protein